MFTWNVELTDRSLVAPSLLQDLDIVFTVFFTLEAAIRVLAHGFVMHPGAYLRSSWHVLDLIVVVTSIIGSFASGSTIGTLSLRLVYVVVREFTCQ
jgi:hypothetical protein